MSGKSTLTKISRYDKLPPIFTSERDREFTKEINSFIDKELSKVDSNDEEQRYLVYKAVFNKIIEHVTSYKPLLTRIKKEYEDTIEAIKNEQQEAAFLQGKLKAKALEPSTIQNYKRRIDELEERIGFVMRDNDRLQKELDEINVIKNEREQKLKTPERPKQQLKKDTRSIPGLTLEQATDMKVLQSKYESLDRQLKEMNNSLRTRHLPKTQKLQLKDMLDNKVTHRDQLLWQSQVYKARVQRLQVALEAAHAYNQVKPPHQTVGDAVTLAFQQASRLLKTERDNVAKEQDDASQTAAAAAAADVDDEPDKEQESEMMLDYIEKFNELFEDGLYEEAAVHAANSPKGILRTQATLAKFRDVKGKTNKGRSPVLAFCVVMMSSVKAAGGKPNQALSRDCVEVALKENHLDLVHYWLAQDRLTLSYQLGKMISTHCFCPIPCLCGCQALAQHIFIRLGSHEDAVLAMLKQDKVNATLQYARIHECITQENIFEVLSVNFCPDFINGLMEEDPLGRRPYFNITIGRILLSLVQLNRAQQAVDLMRAMLKPNVRNDGETTPILSLQRAVTLDRTTTPEQWLTIIKFLDASGQHGMSMQLLALTTVIDIIAQAWSIIQEDRKTVSFSVEIQTPSDLENYNEDEVSIYELSPRSRESTSFDQSSREVSPDVSMNQKNSRVSILKLRPPISSTRLTDSSESPEKSCTPLQKKKVAHRNEMRSLGQNKSKDIDEAERHRDSLEPKLPVSKAWSGIRFMDNDPYTSNPESVGDSDAE